jgi:hypothetical protein
MKNQGVVIDTIYTEDLEIQQDGKKLIILQNSIHIDSLWTGKKYYQSNGSTYYTVQFRKDSVYVKHSSGNAIGNGYPTYAGVKKK